MSSLILAILLSLSSQIMYASLRVSREKSGLAFIRKEAVKAVTWLIKDIRRTHGVSFMYNLAPVGDVPVAISFLTTLGNDAVGPEPTTGIASPKWKAYIVYYLKPDLTNPETLDLSQKYLLKRISVLPVDTYYQSVFNNYLSKTKPLQFTDLVNICNESVTGEVPRVIARNIYGLIVVEHEANYITINIETRDKNPRGGELKTLYTARILMRNTILQSH
ncbi:MAG TPA: hypothetical protein PL110_14765 [Candidatus Eremiobacteraeota bacterium]|nr:hypothetical protein [Candidatus Eremiobacteraeota bacterium]